jgi:hypothetical protein
VGGSAKGKVRERETVWAKFAVLTRFVALWWACALIAGLYVVHARHIPVDFVSFWAAGRLADLGNAAAAYDIAAHRDVEQTVLPIVGVLPFPYPPPFLLLMTLFAVPPFWVAFLLWVATTGGLYVFASSRITDPAFALAQPSVFANGIIGQNGFLTSGIFIAGFELMRRRPCAAGAILGALVIKPQLAVLLPVALLAGREWKAIAGGVVSASALLLLALLVLGPDAYRGFFEILPFYASSVSESRWQWTLIASIFGFARWLGLSQSVSLAIHCIIAALAALLAARAWWIKTKQRVAILAAATILVPPYILTYDALLLIVPLGYLLREDRSPVAIAVSWVFCLLPVLSYFELYSGPNTVPIAALACLWALRCEQARPAVQGAQAL